MKFDFKLLKKRLGQFISYYRPHKFLFFIDMGAAVAQAALTIMLPILVYRVFHIYLPAMNMNAIVICSTLMLVIAALIAGAEYISLRWGHILGVRMEADMRQDLFNHLQKLSFNYFDRTKTGHIMSRISNDLTQIAEVGHHCPEDILLGTLMLIGSLFVMFYINPIMAIVTILPLPIMFLWGTLFRSKMRIGFRDVRRKVADINSQVENSIQGIREVKSFTNEEHEMDRFGEVNTVFKDSRENVYGIMASFHSGMSFIIQCYSLLYVVAGAILMYYGKAQIADILVFLMYTRYFTMPIMRMINFYEQFQQGFAAFDRFIEVIEEAPDIIDTKNPVRPEKIYGNIKCTNLNFKYKGTGKYNSKEDELVLNNINLEIPAGRTIALVGESGAGKTTLAMLIPRFYEVISGEISIDGVNVNKFSQKYLREKIGIVRQSPFLFDTTIRENVLFGRPDATEEEIIEATKAANIYDFIMSLPQGFDSPVGEHGVMLSGGQRQRLSLARVFLKNPPILIFDEATSALDNESEALIKKSLEVLCKDRTTIIIAHRLSTVRNASYIYCMKDGNIVEEGTHSDLIKLEGYYKTLYNMHSF